MNRDDAAGINVARRLPRKTKMTSSTDAKASARATITSRKAASIATPLSIMTPSVPPLGRTCPARPGLRHARAARDGACLGLRLHLDAEEHRGHAVDAREAALVPSGPTRTSATWPSLTRWPSAPRPTTRARKSPAVRSPTSVRSVNSRCRDSQPAGRRFHVLAAQGALDVGDGQRTGGQRLPVEPDPHRGSPRAGERDARDAGDGREPVDDVALGVVGDLEHGAAGQCQPQPYGGIGVGICLADDGRIRFLRQCGERTRHTVTHVVGRGIDPLDVERAVGSASARPRSTTRSCRHPRCRRPGPRGSA